MGPLSLHISRFALHTSKQHVETPGRQQNVLHIDCCHNCKQVKLASAQLRSRLTGPSYRKTKAEKRTVSQNVCRFINNEAKVSGHKKYAYGFILYLCLHILNVILNIFLLDILIDGEFMRLGSRFVS